MEGTALDMTPFSYYFVSSSHQPTPSLPSSTSTSLPILFLILSLLNYLTTLYARIP